MQHLVLDHHFSSGVLGSVENLTSTSGIGISLLHRIRTNPKQIPERPRETGCPVTSRQNQTCSLSILSVPLGVPSKVPQRRHDAAQRQQDKAMPTRSHLLCYLLWIWHRIGVLSNPRLLQLLKRRTLHSWPSAFGILASGQRQMSISICFKIYG